MNAWHLLSVLPRLYQCKPFRGKEWLVYPKSQIFRPIPSSRYLATPRCGKPWYSYKFFSKISTDIIILKREGQGGWEVVCFSWNTKLLNKSIIIAKPHTCHHGWCFLNFWGGPPWWVVVHTSPLKIQQKESWRDRLWHSNKSLYSHGHLPLRSVCHSKRYWPAKKANKLCPQLWLGLCRLLKKPCL